MMDLETLFLLMELDNGKARLSFIIAMLIMTSISHTEAKFMKSKDSKLISAKAKLGTVDQV